MVTRYPRRRAIDAWPNSCANIKKKNATEVASKEGAPRKMDAALVALKTAIKPRLPKTGTP